MRSIIAGIVLVAGLYAVIVLTTWFSVAVASGFELFIAALLIGVVSCVSIAAVIFVADRVGRG